MFQMPESQEPHLDSRLVYTSIRPQSWPRPMVSLRGPPVTTWGWSRSVTARSRFLRPPPQLSDPWLFLNPRVVFTCQAWHVSATCLRSPTCHIRCQTTLTCLMSACRLCHCPPSLLCRPFSPIPQDPAYCPSHTPPLSRASWIHSGNIQVLLNLQILSQ